MRIAFFSDNFYPETSGISDSIITLANELASRGHHIDFYVPYYSKNNYLKGRLPFKDLDFGTNIQIHRLWSIPYPWGPSKQARIVIPTGRTIFSLIKTKPDVIHTQLFFGVGIEALISSKVLNIPLVGTNHTRITSFLPNIPLIGGLVKYLFLHFVSWYYNRCDYVTAPAHFLLLEMRNYGFSKPHQTLSNPIDVGMFEPAKDKSAMKRELSMPDNMLFYAGRLAPEKSIDISVRALAAVRQRGLDATLVLAGVGIAELELKKLAKELGVEGNVRFLGNLDKPPLAKFYQATDVFVLASTSETQSLSLMQAMATALPSVVVDAGALPQYIKDGEDGFIVRANDHKAIAEKIILLLNNRDLRKKIGDRSRQVVETYQTSVVTTQWDEIYKSVNRHG